ncbi:MAG TPA: RecQ family ATP-dependent DNA helicase [Mycobacteriales bacterium]|nr:RecQ family ATP-dependent DNA helicase [Mycobacteriales bacterium]
MPQPGVAAVNKPSVADIKKTAKSHFGWSKLRDGQLDAMQAALSGRDTLVVMPTGSGKSACYQVPALLIDGPTVVVSPLIALQRDQVVDLLDHGAFAANSAQRASTIDEGWEDVAAGDVEFIFLSPEQLAKREVRDRLTEVSPSLFVVDEAHCVAAWGHDFRPDYLRLGDVIEQLGHPVVMALTATAAPPVREEIVRRLGLRDPVEVVRGFDRPNLFLEVVQPRSDEAKRDAVVLRAAAEVKPGIVYTATRKDAETYAAALSDLGLRAASYHAGMRARARDDVHQRFLDDELDVVVATTAFGMGIDKPNVRFVIHADVPESLDAYYQEIGRAGRDGEPSATVLFYRQEDLGLRKFFTSSSADPVVLQRVAKLVEMHDGPIEPPVLREASRLSATRLTTAVNLLEDAGALTVDETGRIALTDDAPSPADAADAAMQRAEERESVDRSRVELVRGYAETTGCRRQFLIGYFGESYDPPCDACDRCASGAVADVETDDFAWCPNDRVRHDSWGDGVVMRCETDRVTVLFETVGYKTIRLDAVVAA